MMSSSKGDSHGKADEVRAGALILPNKSDPNADKGGGGQKIQKFCGHHIWKLLKRSDGSSS